jgi:hypothetical protein
VPQSAKWRLAHDCSEVIRQERLVVFFLSYSSSIRLLRAYCCRNDAFIAMCYTTRMILLAASVFPGQLFIPSFLFTAIQRGQPLFSTYRLTAVFLPSFSNTGHIQLGRKNTPLLSSPAGFCPGFQTAFSSCSRLESLVVGRAGRRSPAALESSTPTQAKRSYTGKPTENPDGRYCRPGWRVYLGWRCATSALA